MEAATEKRMMEPNEIRIVPCIALKPGRVMIVKDGEIVYTAMQGSTEFVQAMKNNPGSLGIVAPDVHRLILKHKDKLARQRQAEVQGALERDTELLKRKQS